MKSPLAQMETVLKALADGTRLRILGLLLGGEVCVCDIHDSLKISQPKTSRHLAYLRRAGLVTTRREGLWVHYSLARPAEPLVSTIQQAVMHALGHVDAVRKDALRLQKRTGCCPPVPGHASNCACCDIETASGQLRV
jgi:ArsR family transcriptional regulator, arsenate/arsenite/antimonite-responsive transcriptional repressor